MLDSVGDNLKSFLSRIHELAKDCGIALFEPKAIAQFPKGFDPFVEISAYRDVLLHNPVIGRGVDVDKTYIRSGRATVLRRLLNARRAYGARPKLCRVRS